MRIYADFNGLHRSPHRSNKQIVPLDTFGSLCDLAHAGIVLAEGAKLTIFDQSDEEEDLEADAIASFDTTLQCWVAEIDAKGIRDVPAQGAKRQGLVCVACRNDLEAFVAKEGLSQNSCCPACEVPVLSPILPPTGAAT